MNATATHAEPAAAESPALERRLVDDGVLLEGIANPPPAAELAARLADPLAGHLERAAWWPDHEERCSQRLGEYSEFAIGLRCRDFKVLYVNFLTEPYCDAVVEISSSQDDHDFDKTAPEAMREVLLRRGYQPGSPRAGFSRRVRVQSVEDCRTLAEAIAGLMVEALGYDATQPVTYRYVLRQRARQEAVLHTLSTGDIARLLRAEGLVVWPDTMKSGRPVWRTVGQRRFNVYPHCEDPPGSGLWAAFLLSFGAKFSPEGAEAALREARTMSFHCEFMVEEDGGFMVLHTVTLVGGVTEEHLRVELQIWRKYLKRIVEAGRQAEIGDD